MLYYRRVRLATDRDKEEFPKGPFPLIGVYEEQMRMENYNMSLYCITTSHIAQLRIPIYTNDLQLAGASLDIDGLKKWAETFAISFHSQMFEVQIEENS